ncbi:MAG: hypothetical protein IRY85_09775 [Micromonosporaceae bacterium]|nr:hypothetical protein [Micromonosporaceae bacterium]
MLDRPPDPTKPDTPVLVPRERPLAVAAAGLALGGSGVVGLLASVALLGGAGPVVDAFRARAVALGVDPVGAGEIARAIRTALLSSGTGTLALAVLSLLLTWGVLARYEAARIGALAVAAVSLGCGVIRTSVTAFGNGVDWSLAAEQHDPTMVAAVAEAFGDAMPSWLVGLGGGLTDLQSFGYIAVIVLLVVPASREYFRTRVESTAGVPVPWRWAGSSRRTKAVPP